MLTQIVRRPAARCGAPSARAGTLLAVEFLLFNFVELKRLQDFNKPGSQAAARTATRAASLTRSASPGAPGALFPPPVPYRWCQART